MTKKTKKVEVKESAPTLDVGAFKNELEELRKELESLRKEKREFSDAEKAAIEEARDEMITDDEVGSLYIDDKYKEEGYHYTIVDTTRPGRVNKRIKQGYEIVYDDLKVGDKTVTNTGSLTGAVTVELGTTYACPGVLMRCPIEHYNKRQAAKVRRNRELDSAMLQDSVNKSDFGSITIGDEVYKK
jgi:hypothetical protein